MNEFIVVAIREDGARECIDKTTGERVIFDKECEIYEQVGETFELEIN